MPSQKTKNLLKKGERAAQIAFPVLWAGNKLAGKAASYIKGGSSPSDEIAPINYNFDAAQAAINDPRVEEARQRMLSEAGIAGGRATEAYGGQLEGRAGQGRLIAALEAQSRGEGPSLAQLQLQRGASKSLSSALAMAQGARGAGRGAALRNLALQQGNVDAEIAGSAAELSMREQLEARGQLAQALAQARGTDVDVMGRQMGQHAGFLGTATNMDLEGQNRALNLALLKEQLEHDERARVQGLRYGQKEAANQRTAGMIQAGAQVGGGLIGSYFGGRAGGAVGSQAGRYLGSDVYTNAPQKLPGTP